MIPYGRQDINEDDIDAVVKILQSDYLTQGPAVPLFERKIAKYVGVKHAVAVNSATSALHLACLALGLGEGDLLWTSPISFVASANCGLYCGANVDFVDIDPCTYNLCPEKLKIKLENAKKIGKLPKVLVAVHLCGQSCNMKAIYELSRIYGFRIIEDASHAIGAKYLGEFVGCCRYSDISVFSFHPVKIITTGEGGIAVTRRPDLASKISLLRSHGITRDEAIMTKESEGGWYYQQLALGFNYRMTDLQAALGVSQLDRLEGFILRRHEIAEKYDYLLKSLPLVTPWQHPDTFSSYHLYIVRLKREKINKTHREVFDQMRRCGIGVNLHYIPIHTQPYYEQLGFSYGDYPEAVKYYSEAISLPIFPALTDKQQEEIVDTLAQTVTI